MRRLSGHPGRFSIMASLFLMLASACSDASKDADAGDLVGKWRFVTTGDYEGYVNGSLKVAVADDGLVTCKLTVYQSEFGSAVEKCRIAVAGDEVVIDIEEIVSSSVPNWRKEVFRLSRSGDEMTGQVRIVVDFPVRFTRKK